MGSLLRPLRRGGDHLRTRRWWYPQIVCFAPVFPLLLLFYLLSRRLTVTLPFCKRHERHWLHLDVALWLGMAASVLVFAGWLFMEDLVERQRGQPWIEWLRQNSGYLKSLSFCGLLLWSTVLFCMNTMAIRPDAWDKKSVLITGLSDEFVRQYLEDVKEEEWQATRDATPGLGHADRSEQSNSRLS